MKCLLFLMLLSVSCSHESLYDGNIRERVDNCDVFENFTVPVKEGYTTYITYQGDTLAVANKPITIKIPQGSASALTKSSGGINIDYAVLETYETYSQYWQAVMFEDSERGDYDYNDLIIHVKNNCEYPWGKDYALQNISIQPIALGSTKVIGLGVLLSDRSEHLVTDDVRRDLFNNAKGFVNTESGILPVRYKLKEWLVNYKLPVVQSPVLAWFIEVDGKRYYAVSSDFNYQDYNMFNDKAMPYGILAYSVFTYPEECTSIYQAYAGFESWINNGSKNIGKSVTNLCYRYSYGNIPRPDGTMGKIWDYADL